MTYVRIRKILWLVESRIHRDFSERAPTGNPLLALQKSSVLVSPLKKGARAERDSVMERARKDERQEREGGC